MLYWNQHNLCNVSFQPRGTVRASRPLWGWWFTPQVLTHFWPDTLCCLTCVCSTYTRPEVWENPQRRAGAAHFVMWFGMWFLHCFRLLWLYCESIAQHRVSLSSDLAKLGMRHGREHPNQTHPSVRWKRHKHANEEFDPCSPLMRFLFARSWWICSGRSCGHGAGDSANYRVFCCDSTQGEALREWHAHRSETRCHTELILTADLSSLSCRRLQLSAWSPFWCTRASKRSTSRDIYWPFQLQHP